MKQKRPLTATLFVAVMLALGASVILKWHDKGPHPTSDTIPHYWSPADPDQTKQIAACVSGHLKAISTGDHQKARTYFVSQTFFISHLGGTMRKQASRQLALPRRMGPPKFGRCFGMPGGEGAYIEVHATDIDGGAGENMGYFLMKEHNRYKIFWYGVGDEGGPDFLKTYIPPLTIEHPGQRQ